MTERPHEKLPGENAHDDRREPIEHVGKKSHEIGEAGPALLGEIQSCPDADGEPDNGGDANQHERPENRVRHAASVFAHGLRHVREEADRERSGALLQEVSENDDQRDDRERRGDTGERHHEDADAATACQPTRARPRIGAMCGSDRAHARTSLPMRHTSHRAMAFTISVMTRRTKPTAIKAER